MNLSVGLFGDGNTREPAFEHGSPPVVESADLLGEISVEVAHKIGLLLRISWAHQQVEVVGHYRDDMQLDWVEFLGSADDTQESIVEFG